MFKLKFTVEPQLTATLKRLKETPKLFGAALYAEATPLMDGARERAPSDVGGLLESSYVTRPSGGESAPSVELGFAAPWAAYVHERMDLPHPQGGEPKFLERSLDAGAGDFYNRVAKHVAGWIAKGEAVEVSGRYPTAPPSIGQERHAARKAGRRTQLRKKLRRK